MKVFVDPIPVTLSRAMFRVANALRQYAPDSVEIVNDARKADVQVLHAVGPDSYDRVVAPQFAVIQYCLFTFAPINVWRPHWLRARLVWSYYELAQYGNGFPFYHAPLGVDPIFAHSPLNSGLRDIGVMTSGYVTGSGAEAIEEMIDAADDTGLIVTHLGPSEIQGMERRVRRSILGVSDPQLADLYGRCEWVSGLRHVEGFELPALEGLCCGARPIVFDRPDMTQWYEDHAVFVPECDGDELRAALVEVLMHRPAPVSEAERSHVAATFDWRTIATGFWERLLP